MKQINDVFSTKNSLYYQISLNDKTKKPTAAAKLHKTMEIIFGSYWSQETVMLVTNYGRLGYTVYQSHSPQT